MFDEYIFPYASKTTNTNEADVLQSPLVYLTPSNQLGNDISAGNRVAINESLVHVPCQEASESDQLGLHSPTTETIEQPSEQVKEPDFTQMHDNTAGRSHEQEINNSMAQGQEQSVEEEGVLEVVPEVVHSTSTGSKELVPQAAGVFVAAWLCQFKN
ncbi:hypothetical protein V6N12_053062 [Hibiscus sabdariffa]|uniref:Uncharacterized protein n=1 Tax=Hibiscus sabdariffa TaxID=183260 RepID=A0ABR2AX80_9ROSI